MILYVAAAALGAGLIAAAAALVVWRAASRHARTVDRLDVRLAELSLRLERDRAGRRDEELIEGFGALRDDIAILCTHVSSLTGGQLDIKRVVAAAVAKEVAALIERIDDAEGKAAERALHLRDRIESAIDAAADGARAPAEGPEHAALARVEARLDALAEAVAAPEDSGADALTETLTGALARLETRLADIAAAPGAAGPEAVEAAVSDGVTRVLERLAEMEAHAPPPPAPRRAPAVFDGGRVVTLIAPAARDGAAAGASQAAG
jgi:hypothetical protein